MKWTKTKEAMPTVQGLFIVKLHGCSYIQTAIASSNGYGGIGFIRDDKVLSGVTHWMPLPKLPEGPEDES